MEEVLYPVLSLNTNITAFLKKVISADIFGCVKTGLKNDIDLTDKGTHITSVASIEKCDEGVSSQVKLSSAYCQYLWLLCDVVLKILDRRVITAACIYYGISLEAFLQSVEETNKKKTKEQVLPFIPDFFKPDIERYLAYLKIVPELLADDFWTRVGFEYALSESLKEIKYPIDIEGLKSIDMNSKYSERTNSVYSYGIAFCLLHELAHHQLGHLEKEEEMKDEVDADAQAFWNIYKDITGEERFSANIGILCVFFSFMMLNPTLKEDYIHPREDKRMFAIYDRIVKENPKYTLLLVYILDFWGKMNKIVDYPTDLEPVDESVKKIKEYFKIG